jgi:hypothetical protein
MANNKLVNTSERGISLSEFVLIFRKKILVFSVLSGPKVAGEKENEGEENILSKARYGHHLAKLVGV